MAAREREHALGIEHVAADDDHALRAIGNTGGIDRYAQMAAEEPLGALERVGEAAGFLFLALAFAGGRVPARALAAGDAAHVVGTAPCSGIEHPSVAIATAGGLGPARSHALSHGGAPPDR